MISTFKTTKSHPHLDWLSRMPLNRSVPPQTAAKLAAITSMDKAKTFVENAGLEVVTKSCRELGKIANGVAVAPPHNLPQIFREHSQNYYSMQAVFPEISCEVFPFGSVILNCLLATIKDESNAQAVFRAYQSSIQTFCNRLEALPFAVITGIKSEHDFLPHDLYDRGFRFIFSPDPDPLFERIIELFETIKILGEARDKGVAEGEAVKAALDKYFALRRCSIGDEEKGHIFFEDIGFYSSDTTVVDLR